MNKPDYLISTPENVDLHLELAGLGNRIFACSIDTLINYAIILLLALLCALGVGVVEYFPMADRMRTIADYAIIGLTIIVVLFIFFGYHIFFEGLWQGQSPGKRAVGIRVIELNGQPVSWPAVIIRNLIRVVDMGLMLIGLAVMLFDRTERRLGDLAAGTLVIRERLPAPTDQNLTIKETSQPTGFVDIGRISPKEYDLLVSFLSRREKLSKSQRPLLARRLEHYLRARLNEPPAGESPELFLERLYLAYRARATSGEDA